MSGEVIPFPVTAPLNEAGFTAILGLISSHAVACERLEEGGLYYSDLVDPPVHVRELVAAGMLTRAQAEQCNDVISRLMRGGV